MVRAPESLTTERLVLRRPVPADAPTVFTRYASDPEVTRWLGWARHRAVADTEAFVRWSDEVWARAPAGPYLIESRADGQLLGGTGLDFEAPWRVTTGYVLATDAWGRGVATEATQAMAELADALGVRRLSALCHVDHRASSRVLEKCGFLREGVLRRYLVFPNLDPAEPADVECWARVR
jgi:[ribosomal protein S5]-alanine N-acetyltransferase